MSADLNSAYVYILDACGHRYCEAFMHNVEATIESQKDHCRWWLRRRNTGCVKPAKIVVEFYDDPSPP